MEQRIGVIALETKETWIPLCASCEEGKAMNADALTRTAEFIPEILRNAVLFRHKKKCVRVNFAR